jgi:hypothetical protein
LAPQGQTYKLPGAICLAEGVFDEFLANGMIKRRGGGAEESLGLAVEIRPLFVGKKI